MSVFADLESELISFITTEVTAVDDAPGPDTDLLLSGLVDSLGVMRIVDWLEQTYGGEVDPGDVVLENFQTVSAIASYMRGRANRA